MGALMYPAWRARRPGTRQAVLGLDLAARPACSGHGGLPDPVRAGAVRARPELQRGRLAVQHPRGRARDRVHAPEHRADHPDHDPGRDHLRRLVGQIRGRHVPLPRPDLGDRALPQLLRARRHVRADRADLRDLRLHVRAVRRVPGALGRGRVRHRSGARRGRPLRRRPGPGRGARLRADGLDLGLLGRQRRDHRRDHHPADEARRASRPASPPGSRPRPRPAAR